MVLLLASPSAAFTPVPHMVHGLSSAPGGRCTVWQCTMCGPKADRGAARHREQRARAHGVTLPEDEDGVCEDDEETAI